MCITLISDVYTRINLVIEQIFLSTSDGNLSAHEVYDVFLAPTEDWKEARILCLSPHHLLKDSQIAVQAHNAPGAGGRDDVFFKDPILSRSEYDTTNNIFSVELPATQNAFVLDNDIIHGTVLLPQIQLPHVLADDELAKEFMAECGTLFELHLGNLEKGMTYVFRLTIDPVKLMGLPRRRSEDIREVDGILSRWVQDATVTCPRTCRFNYLAITSKERDLPEYAEAATTIEGLIKSAKLTMMPLIRHQIVLILPPGAELTGSTSEGCTWPATRHTLADGRLAATWTAGTSQYWRDEPESVARRIFKTFGSLAKNKPVTVNDVSSELDMSLANCRLATVALRKYGALESVKRGLYQATRKSKVELDRIFIKVATQIANDFKWRGYQIRYSVRYRWLSTEDKELLKVRRIRREKAYNYGRRALILAAISLSVTLIALLIRLGIAIGRHYFSGITD